MGSDTAAIQLYSHQTLQMPMLMDSPETRALGLRMSECQGKTGV